MSRVLATMRLPPPRNGLNYPTTSTTGFISSAHEGDWPERPSHQAAPPAAGFLVFIPFCLAVPIRPWHRCLHRLHVV